MSGADQNPRLQAHELAAAGCLTVFTDTASGAFDRRPGLERVPAELRDGDTLVLWRLDRPGRSLRHLIDVMTDLDALGFRSLRESIDMTTPVGRLVCHPSASLAQFERELIGERTRAGLAAARA